MITLTGGVETFMGNTIVIIEHSADLVEVGRVGVQNTLLVVPSILTKEDTWKVLQYCAGSIDEVS